MSNLYGRVYELTLVNYTELLQRSIPKSVILPNSPYTGQSREIPSLLAGSNKAIGYTDFLTIPSDFTQHSNNIASTGDNARVITDLRIRANVVWNKESSAGSNTQESYIEVYNMAPNSRKFLGKNTTVMLKAGYEGTSDTLEGLPLIVTGQAYRVVSTKTGEDTITKIFIKDAGFISNNFRISKWYTPPTSYREVIEDMAVELANKGLPTGYIQTGLQQFINFNYTEADGIKQPLMDLNNTVGLQGLSIFGFALDELKRVCTSIGYRAYTSLGKLYVEPVYSGGYKDYIQIGPDNVKGGIREEVDTSSKFQAQGDAKGGIVVETFLDPRIKLDVGITINDIDEYEGDYKITKITHKLDLEGKDWTTEVNCIKETI